MTTVRNRNGGKQRPSSVTPLGIIAGFVALAETVGGIAATLTDGGIQITFAAFAVGFPVLVGAAFFGLLWKRPYVFYPPQDFGADVDVRHYVDAMRQQAIGNQEVVALIRESIQGAIRSPEARDVISQLAKSPGPNATAALEKASVVLARRAMGQLQEAVLTVDIREFSNSHAAPDLLFRFNPQEEAFAFLSAIYYQISESVPAFTYGKIWALRDTESNKLLLPDGVDWSNNYSLANSDATVSDLGIVAGMRLRAERVNGATLKGE